MTLERIEFEDGTVEEVVYLDSEGEEVDKARATRWIVHRFDSRGGLLKVSMVG